MTVIVGGCDETRPPSTTRPAVVRTAIGADGRPVGASLLHVDVYVVDLPAGAVSDDASFWRAVDENAVGGRAGQRLHTNGIRSGIVPRNHWDQLAQRFAREVNVARHAQASGTSTQTVSLDVGDMIDHENLFFVNADWQLEGHTYDRATNGIALTFGPAPRDPGTVRLSFCPSVRCERRVLAFSPMNQPYEARQGEVERLYDVGLSADVPPDGVFVVSPSPMADTDTFGGRFLVRQLPAARRELAIVVVPNYVLLTGRPAVNR